MITNSNILYERILFEKDIENAVMGSTPLGGSAMEET